MVKRYERKNWRDDFERYVELLQVKELLAVFHTAPVFTMGHVYTPPTDPEVGLTEEDLQDRVTKREAARLEVDEEKRAKLDFERYWQDPRRKALPLGT